MNRPVIIIPCYIETLIGIVDLECLRESHAKLLVRCRQENLTSGSSDPVAISLNCHIL
jgi:hypothetical protein